MLSSGEHGVISSVEIEHYDEPQTTYNFEVEILLPVLTRSKYDKITANEAQSFNVEGKGLIDAKDIKVGDKLILESGVRATILSLEAKTIVGPQTTYNFEVEDFHTYYVGESGVLCHNVCTGDKILYRGGDKMTVRARDVDIIDDLVQPTRGISVNSNPNMITNFGTPHQLGTLPDGLKAVVTSGTHFEIVPTYAMGLDKYQSLLNMIPLKPI